MKNEQAEHLYVASRVLGSLGDGNSIVEVGAGYGGTAYWINLLNPTLTKYVIHDLPQINVVQGYFLSKALGVEVVSFYGESRKSIAVLPCNDLLDEPFNLLVNENSMPEIPEGAVHDYLRWSKKSCKRFYSYNHEAINPTQPQVLVRDEVAAVGGYELRSRTPSWLRRGYIEELYDIR